MAQELLVRSEVFEKAIAPKGEGERSRRDDKEIGPTMDSQYWSNDLVLYPGRALEWQ